MMIEKAKNIKIENIKYIIIILTFIASLIFYSASISAKFATIVEQTKTNKEIIETKVNNDTYQADIKNMNDRLNRIESKLDKLLEEKRK